MSDHLLPEEGDLYKVIEIDRYTFELRYGYYEEFERKNGFPVVIFPDLEKERLYTGDGYRLVTQVQDCCEYYSTETSPPEEWCSDCIYFVNDENEIGICRNDNMSVSKQGGTENV